MTKTKSPGPTAVRYDEKAIARIVSFLKKGHSNVEAKAEFGCSAHFAGRIRAKFKIPFPEKPETKAVKAVKGTKGKKDLL